MAADYSLFSEHVLVSMLQQAELELFTLEITGPEPTGESTYQLKLAYAKQTVAKLSEALKTKAENEVTDHSTTFLTTEVHKSSEAPNETVVTDQPVSSVCSSTPTPSLNGKQNLGFFYIFVWLYSNQNNLVQLIPSTVSAIRQLQL